MSVPSVSNGRVASSASIGSQPTQAKLIPYVNFHLVFMALNLAFFIVQIDSAVLPNAVPVIIREFDSKNISWASTAYFITLTSFSAISGILCDTLGSKLILILSVLIFEVGATLVGVGINVNMIIVARAIQGVGAAGVYSSTLIILYEIAPKRSQGKLQATMVAVGGASLIIGPLVGGYIADNFNWRWSFFMHSPLALVSLWLTATNLKTSPAQNTESWKVKIKRIDFIGLILMIAATFCLIIPFHLAKNSWEWKSASVILLLGIGVFLTIGFLISQYYLNNALIQKSLFQNRSVYLIFATTFLLGACVQILCFYIPIFYELVESETAFETGVKSLPLLVGMVGSSIISSFLLTLMGRYKMWYFIATVTLGIALVLLGIQSKTTPEYVQGITLLLAGVGCGCLTQIRILSINSSVSPKLVASAVGVSNFLYNLGGTLALGVVGGILAEHTNFDSPSNLRNGFVFIFWGLLPLVGLMFVLSFFIREYDFDFEHTKIDYEESTTGKVRSMAMTL